MATLSDELETERLKNEYVFLKRLIDDHLAQKHTGSMLSKNKLRFHAKHTSFVENHYNGRKNIFKPLKQNANGRNVFKIDRTQPTNMASKPISNSSVINQVNHIQAYSDKPSLLNKISVSQPLTDKYKLIKRNIPQRTHLPPTPVSFNSNTHTQSKPGSSCKVWQKHPSTQKPASDFKQQQVTTKYSLISHPCSHSLNYNKVIVTQLPDVFNCKNSQHKNQISNSALLSSANLKDIPESKKQIFYSKTGHLNAIRQNLTNIEEKSSNMLLDTKSNVKISPVNNKMLNNRICDANCKVKSVKDSLLNSKEERPQTVFSHVNTVSCASERNTKKIPPSQKLPQEDISRMQSCVISDNILNNTHNIRPFTTTLPVTEGHSCIKSVPEQVDILERNFNTCCNPQERQLKDSSSLKMIDVHNNLSEDCSEIPLKIATPNIFLNTICSVPLKEGQVISSQPVPTATTMSLSSEDKETRVVSPSAKIFQQRNFKHSVPDPKMSTESSNKASLLKQLVTNNNLSQITKNSIVTSGISLVKSKRKRQTSTSLTPKGSLHGVVKMIKTKYKVVNKKSASPLPFPEVLNTRYRIINKRKLPPISSLGISSVKSDIPSNLTLMKNQDSKENVLISGVSTQWKISQKTPKLKPLNKCIPNSALLQSNPVNYKLKNESLTKFLPSDKNFTSLVNKNRIVKVLDKSSTPLICKTKYKLIKKKLPEVKSLDKNVTPLTAKFQTMRKKHLSTSLLTKGNNNSYLNKGCLNGKSKYKFVKISDKSNFLPGKNKYELKKKSPRSTNLVTRLVKTNCKLINKSVVSSNRYKIVNKNITASGLVSPQLRLMSKNHLQGSVVKVVKTKFRVVNKRATKLNLNNSGAKSLKTKYKVVNKKNQRSFASSVGLKTRYSVINNKASHSLTSASYKAKRRNQLISSAKKIQLPSNRKFISCRNDFNVARSKFNLVNIKNTSPSLTLKKLIKNKYKLINKRVSNFSPAINGLKYRSMWQGHRTGHISFVSGFGKMRNGHHKYNIASGYHLRHGLWRIQRSKNFKNSERFPRRTAVRKKRHGQKMIMIGGISYRVSKTSLSKTSSHKKVSNRKVNYLKTKMQVVSICGVRYQMDSSGKVLKRMPTEQKKQIIKPEITRVSLGGQMYVQTQPGVLTKTNFPQVRTLANRVVNRSIHRVLAASEKKKMCKNNMYCMFYNRFGKCNKGDECRYIHDSHKVAVCTRFLRGTCKVTDCPFSHEVSPDKMPVCHYFLQGTCTNKDCPYRHVEIDPRAEVCKEFLKGYCHKGKECKKTHIFVCPDFAQKGQCDKRSCPWPHPPRKAPKLLSSTVSVPGNVCLSENAGTENDISRKKGFSEGKQEENGEHPKDFVKENQFDGVSERYFNCETLISELLTYKMSEPSEEDICKNSDDSDKSDSDEYYVPAPKRLRSLPDFIPLETDEQSFTEKESISVLRPTFTNLSNLPSFMPL